MSDHCSPTHSTPRLWHGLPDLIPKHLGPKPLGQPMDDPLGPKLMNDLFARFYCIGLKSNNYSEHMLNHVNTFLQFAWCMYVNVYTSQKRNKHNIRRPYTTVRQSIYTVLTLYLQLIYVYIYMFLSTTNHTFPGTGKAMRRPINTWADDLLGNLGQFTHRIRGTGILSYICWLILMGCS